MLDYGLSLLVGLKRVFKVFFLRLNLYIFAMSKTNRNLNTDTMDKQWLTEEARLVTEVYEKHKAALLGYICKRIHNNVDAEDMLQDLFVRMLEFRDMICEATVMSFAYTIARNLVVDYVRRRRCTAEIYSYIYDRRMQTGQVSMESHIYMRNLEDHERLMMEQMPPQRRKVYYMNRFEGKEVDHIAEELHVESRTVEKHLLLGRRTMRTYLKSVGFGD